MLLTEDDIIKAITEWMTYCDKDELARLTGELFGGKCFPTPKNNLYEFEPDENYAGAFEKKNLFRRDFKSGLT